MASPAFQQLSPPLRAIWAGLLIVIAIGILSPIVGIVNIFLTLDDEELGGLFNLFIVAPLFMGIMLAAAVGWRRVFHLQNDGPFLWIVAFGSLIPPAGYFGFFAWFLENLTSSPQHDSSQSDGGYGSFIVTLVWLFFFFLSLLIPIIYSRFLRSMKR